MNYQVAVNPRSKAKIEDLAMSIRQSFCSDSLFFPIVSVLEILSTPIGDNKPLFELEIVSDKEMPFEYATYSPVSNKLRVRESVYLGACNGNGRDRFTLAHEFGHFVMHRRSEYQLARANEAIPAYRDPEWQANTFASMIRGMSVDEVALRCGTSKQAAKIALNK